MKVFIVLASFIAVASAGHLYGAAPLAAVSDGSSSQFRSEDDYGNYQFGYDESHATGGSSRREEETGGVRRGSYSLSDADGRRRVVNYIADDTGFHADIQTNEPGVEPKDPANVLINKNGAVAVAAAPAPLAIPAPAPILAAPVKGYVAQAPIAAPAPILAAPVKTFAPIAAPAQILAAPVKTFAPIAAPAPIAQAPIYETAQVIEAPTPRAFSYSFGSTHIAPVASYARAAPVASYAHAAPVASYAAPAPIAAPIASYAAPAPIAAPFSSYARAAPAPIAAPAFAPAPVAAPAPIFQQSIEY